MISNAEAKMKMKLTKDLAIFTQEMFHLFCFDLWGDFHSISWNLW